MTNIRRKIYVTEPNMINMDLAREILKGDAYELIEGNTAFQGDNLTDVDTLLIRSQTHIDDTILEFFPNLRHVIRVGVGLDNVDVEFLTSHNVKVYNAPGANSDAVAEYVVTMLLGALRHTTPLSLRDVVSWDRMHFMGRSVSSLIVGIVGFGNIGRLLQQKLRALGCDRFYIYDPYLPAEVTLDKTITKVENLDDLITNCNVISLHLPLLPTTKYIINAEKLEKMQNETIIINAARGGIVHERDLLKVMKHKPLYYIADVVEGEPNINQALLNQKNITITPHIGSLTKEANDTMLRVALAGFIHDSK